MNDNLRKARERDRRRLDESILDPVEIRSLTDIKKKPDVLNGVVL